MISKQYFKEIIEELKKNDEAINKKSDNANEFILEKQKKLEKRVLQLSKHINNLEYQISCEAKRCDTSKDYDFALFVKNGKPYLYKRGENVGGECKHFECTYDFKTNSTEYKIEY